MSEHTPTRFEQKYVPEPNTGCWLWTAALNTYGYGKYRMGNAAVAAHRVSYELARGPIPSGMVVDHLCRVRSCVNPDHMEVVSRGENVLRGVGISARNKSKDRCPKGHPYNGVKKNGNRFCNTCVQAMARARYAARRALSEA